MRERLRFLVKTEGHLGAILLLCQSIVLFTGLVTYLILTPAYLQLPLSHVVRLSGFIIGIPGLLLLVWTHYTLDKYWSITIEFQERHVLVTSGPYKWVRHPMYTAHLIYFLSWLLVTTNQLFLLNYLLTIAIIIRRIPREERELIKKFGQKYIEYMKKTKRLISYIY